MKALKYGLSVILLMIGIGINSAALATHVYVFIDEAPDGSVSVGTGLPGVQITSAITSLERASITGVVVQGSTASPSLGQAAYVLMEGGTPKDLTVLTVTDIVQDDGFLNFQIEFYSDPFPSTLIPANAFLLDKIPENLCGGANRPFGGSCSPDLARYFDLSPFPGGDGFHIMVHSDFSAIPEPAILVLFGLGVIGLWFSRRKQA